MMIKLIRYRNTLQMLNPQLVTLPATKQFLTCAQSPLSSHSTVDVHYELCQTFMRQTAQQLHHKEAQLMSESQDLINQFNTKPVKKKQSGWGDSAGEETTASFNEDRPQEQSACTNKSSAGRKVEARMSGWLREVEEKCSPLCAAGVRTLIWDHQQLLENRLLAQAKHKILSRKHSQMERIHEENLILKKRLETQSVKSDSLRSELQGMTGQKSKALEYAQKKLQQILTGQRVTEINAKVFRQIRNYLQDRERSASSRVVRAESIQSELLRLLDEMSGGSCDECCQMLRRVKESLLRIKGHLEQETAEMDQAYSKYKKTLFVGRAVPL